MALLYTEYHCEIPGVARCYGTYTPANPPATRYEHSWVAPFDTGIGYIPKPTATSWGSAIPYPNTTGNGVGGHWNPGTSSIKVNQFDTLGAVCVLLYRDYDSITGWSAWGGLSAGMSFGFGVSKNGGAWTPVAFSSSSNDFKGYPLGSIGMTGANMTVPVPPYPGASTYSCNSKQIVWITTGWSQTMGWGFGNHWDVRMWAGWAGGTTLAAPYDGVWWQSVGSAPAASGGFPYNGGYVTAEFSFDSQDYLPSVIIPVGVDLEAHRDIDNFFVSNLPVISSFTALPASLPFGGGLTNLSWNVTGANSLSIDQGVGDVTGLTNINVNPVTSTIYTLTATNFDGTVIKFVNVPVAAAPILVTGFTMSSITTAPNRIIVTAPFDVSIDECDITNWTVSNVPGISAVTVERISVDGDEITIYTSEQTQGGLYTLNLPYRFILNDTGTQQCTTTTMNFTGTGIGIKVHHIEVSPTWDYVDVTFDEDAYDVDALDHNNYIIAGVTIYSVIKLVNKSYRLSTSRLDPNTSYTLVANVRDIHYNA